MNIKPHIIKPHIDDEIYRVREFMKELKKIQDDYYKGVEKKLLKDPLYTVDKLKKDFKEITGSSSFFDDDEDSVYDTPSEKLTDYFWDYMNNEDEGKAEDFVEYLIKCQKIYDDWKNCKYTREK